MGHKIAKSAKITSRRAMGELGEHAVAPTTRMEHNLNDDDGEEVIGSGDEKRVIWAEVREIMEPLLHQGA